MLAGCVSPPDPEPAVRQVDADADGRTDVFVRLAPDGSTLGSAAAPTPGTDPERTLVLAIDAVPWETMRQLQEEGRYRWLFPASRLAAPFPSLTDVSFTVLLQASAPEGYEDEFFDPVRNEIGGGLLDRVTGAYKGFAPFHDVFDWEEPHIWGGAVYLVPERIATLELRRFAEVLEENRDDPELVVYLGSTDGLGHIRGRDALARQMVAIEPVLLRWLARGESDRRVVLFSDHAMTREPSRMLDLSESLEGAGFRLASRIESPRDVVAPAYGLVGSVALYTACGREEEVARAVVRQEGVDFAVWQDGERRGAVDRHGGDPFARRGGEAYPDSRRRAFRGLELTRSPASVLVSLEDGWHRGDRLFEAFVDLAGTHGSIRRSSSEGFLASNVERTPASIDAEDAYGWLGLERPPAPREPVPYRCVTPRSPNPASRASVEPPPVEPHTDR